VIDTGCSIEETAAAVGRLIDQVLAAHTAGSGGSAYARALQAAAAQEVASDAAGVAATAEAPT
jgi:uncharacterized protein YggL (DUF469 family)